MVNQTHSYCCCSRRESDLCCDPYPRDTSCCRLYCCQGNAFLSIFWCTLLTCSPDYCFSMSACAPVCHLWNLQFCLLKLSITILGIVQLARGHTSTSLTEPLFRDTSTSPSAYALALYSGLWAFDGWDQANYVGGEMKRPEKNIPRAIHTSMAIVMVSIRYYPLFRSNSPQIRNALASILVSQPCLFRGTRQGNRCTEYSMNMKSN